MNAIENYAGAADVGITPDDSPALEAYLQGTLESAEAQISSPQQLIIKPESDGNVIVQIEMLLRSRYAFRYNVVSNNVQFRRLSNKTAKYDDMRDYNWHSILREIKLADIKCSKDTLRMILQSEFVPLFDPYVEYIEGLPAWDGVTDHIGQLVGTVTTTNQDFFDWCFH